MTTPAQLPQQAKDALLGLHNIYVRSLAPILHMAFAEVRNFYEELDIVLDANESLYEIGDELDVPLESILTNVKLLAKLFDDAVRPICPERFAKVRKKQDIETNITLPNVLVDLLENVNKLMSSYASLEVDGESTVDTSQKLKGIAFELNILCIMFLRLLSESPK